ncbi:MAG: hypothetical protein ACOZBH_02150 [Patescibacteria group bacterium]
MPRNFTCRALIVILMVAFSMTLTGCSHRPFLKSEEDSSEDINSIAEEEQMASSDSIALPTTRFADWRDDIPSNAEKIKTLELDLNGDGENEIAVLYLNPSVIRREGDIRKIFYLNIYQKKADGWYKIKQDEATAAGGTVDTAFCLFNSINLGNDKTQELLVSKCSQQGGPSGLSGYYVFGLTPGGSLDDLTIPKGYLHKEDLLRPGDDFEMLKKVEASGKGIEETYEIACASRDWFASRFGDQAGGFCRQVTLYIPYSQNAFGERQVLEDKNLIYTEQFETTALSANKSFHVNFNRPIWLISSETQNSTEIKLSDPLNYFVMNFGDDFNAIRIFSLNNVEIPDDIDSTDTKKLLEIFCDRTKNYSDYGNQVLNCAISGDIAIAQGKHTLIMAKFFEGSDNSVSICLSAEDREITYFDEAVMKTIIDSFRMQASDINQ